MIERQNAIVFASGEKDGGGTGFEGFVRYANANGSGASYRICAVVSNHANGGVYERAKRLGIPFEYFPAPWSPEAYERIVAKYSATWVLCSGWLKLVPIRRTGLLGSLLSLVGCNKGLDPRTSINIHPTLLSHKNGKFGGPGVYGDKAHLRVYAALMLDELDERIVDYDNVVKTAAYSGFTLHFMGRQFDDPSGTFAEVRVRIDREMLPGGIAKAVKTAEHLWQPLLVDMVVTGKIRFENGKVTVPQGYGLLPK